MMFWNKSRNNGNGKSVEPVDAGLLGYLVEGRGPVSIDGLKRARAMDRIERARLIMETRDSDGFHALMYEVLAAKEAADVEAASNPELKGKEFVGARELLGALGVVFSIAQSRIAIETEKDEEGPNLLRKVMAAVTGKRGDRPFRGMTDYSTEEWDVLLKRFNAAKAGKESRK